MSGVNKVILIGHLGGDPEAKAVGDKTVCQFSIATNESWTDKSGNKQEKVEWHKIVVWGKLADNCAKYLSKGREVFVEGRIQTRTYDDKEGIKRYMTEIVANEVKFLGGGDKDKKESSSKPRVGSDEAPPPTFAPGDDIPF